MMTLLRRSAFPGFLSVSSPASRLRRRGRRRARTAARVFLAYERLEGRWCPSTIYDFDVIAATGQQSLSAMGNGPSINDNGTVAFVGDFQAGNEGLFTGDGTAAGLKNINPSYSNDPNRTYGNAVEINDSGTVLAMDTVTIPGYTQYTLRTWNPSASASYWVYARAGAPRGPFDSFDALSNYAAFNNNGGIVYSALNDSISTPVWDLQYQTSIFGHGSTVATLSNPQVLRPAISDTPQIVARIGGTNSTADPLTGYAVLPAPIGQVFGPFGVAGLARDFDQIGPAPGISSDGQVIAFAGRLTASSEKDLGLTSGQGIFARVLIPDPSKPAGSGATIPAYVRIAGVAPGLIQSFDLTQPVGTNGSTVVFLATDGSGHKALFSASVNVVGPNDPTKAIPAWGTNLTEIAYVGGTLSTHTGNFAITNLSIHDPINKSGQIAFWAATSEGDVILRANAIRTPVFIVPGIAGTFPTGAANIAYWYLNRGVDPSILSIDPIGHTYDDLIHSFENAGYTLNQDLFVVLYDWRVPPAPTNTDFNGTITDTTGQRLTGQEITSTPYLYGIDYLGHYLEVAAQTWARAHPNDPPLPFVNVVAHSTGGLVTRSYIQSGAYNDFYDGVHRLPAIDNFVELDVPNLGASKAWNPLHDDWAIDTSYIVLSKILNTALKYLKLKPLSAFINNPDGTIYQLADFMTNGVVDENKFIKAYVPTIRALLATYPFLDTTGLGTFSTVNGQAGVRNDLALDLAGGNPQTYLQSIGHLDIVYGDGVGTTPVTVTQMTSTGNPAAQKQSTLGQWQAVLPPVGTTYYRDNMAATGDGTVPLVSEQSGFTANSSDVTLLGYSASGQGLPYERQSSGAVDHTGIVSNPDVEEEILSAFGSRINPSKVSKGHGNNLSTYTNLFFLIVDPVQAVVTDASGNQLGYTGASGPLAEIPGSEFIGGSSGIGIIYGPTSSTLTLTLTGLGGSYSVGLGGVQGSSYNGTEDTGTLAAGATKVIPLTFPPSAVVGLTASDPAPGPGEAVTFTATVAAAALGGASPTGTVQFQVDGTDVGGAVALVNGAATSHSVTLTAGSHTITAVYSGDSTYPGAPGSLTLTAAPPAATLALSASDATPIVGETVTFTATVAPPAPGEPTPTGTVQFEVDGNPLGSAVTLAGGAATSGRVTLTDGAHTVIAVYSGDSAYSGAPGSLTLTASIPTAAVAVAASAAPPIAGQAVTFTATVTPAASGDPAPSGTVQFQVDGTAVGSAVALTNGMATSGGVTLAAGSHTIAAVYSGNSTYAVTTGSLTVSAATLPSSAPGSLDPTFGNAGVVQPKALAALNVAFDAQGRILVTGAGTVFRDELGLQRFTADGQPDHTFGSAGNVDYGSGVGLGGAGEGVAVEPDGKIVCINEDPNNHTVELVRFYDDGAIDTTFGIDGVAQPPSFTLDGNPDVHNASYYNVQIATLPDGRILLAGMVIFSGIVNPGCGLAMYLPNGQLDRSFNGTGTVLVSPTDPGDVNNLSNLAVDNNEILLLLSGGTAGTGIDRIRLYGFNLDGTRTRRSVPMVR